MLTYSGILCYSMLFAKSIFTKDQMSFFESSMALSGLYMITNNYVTVSAKSCIVCVHPPIFKNYQHYLQCIRSGYSEL